MNDQPLVRKRKIPWLWIGCGTLAIIAASCACIVFILNNVIPSLQIPTPTARVSRATQQPPATTQPTPPPVPMPTATVSVAPPFQEIRDYINSTDRTEAQRKEYIRNLEGLWVERWEGWVYDVNEKLGGHYELWISMDPPDTIFRIHHVEFDIPDDMALEFQKDQWVTFSGQIRSIDTGIFTDRLSTIHLADAAVEP